MITSYVPGSRYCCYAPVLQWFSVVICSIIVLQVKRDPIDLVVTEDALHYAGEYSFDNIDAPSYTNHQGRIKAVFKSWVYRTNFSEKNGTHFCQTDFKQNKREFSLKIAIFLNNVKRRTLTLGEKVEFLEGWGTWKKGVLRGSTYYYHSVVPAFTQAVSY